MINLLLTPALDLLKFGLVHLFLIPLFLAAFDADKLLPQVDAVTASKLNIRVDSSVAAFSPGYLQEGAEVEVIHRGESWSQIEFERFFKTVSKEKSQENATGHYYVATKYLGKTHQNIFKLYSGWICVVQLICYIILLVTNYKNFVLVLWNRIFSLKTIPESIYHLLLSIISLLGMLKAKKKALS